MTSMYSLSLEPRPVDRWERPRVLPGGAPVRIRAASAVERVILRVTRRPALEFDVSGHGVRERPARPPDHDHPRTLDRLVSRPPYRQGRDVTARVPIDVDVLQHAGTPGHDPVTLHALPGRFVRDPLCQNPVHDPFLSRWSSPQLLPCVIL